MRKMLAVVLSVLLLTGFSLPCFAEGVPSQRVVSTSTRQTEDGFTIVTTIEVGLLSTRSVRGGSITEQYYYDGQEIGTMILMGTFYYDGSTARATGASKSYSTASGWSYSGGDARASGASVSVSGSFVSGAKRCAVDMSLTCSPSGALS